MQSNDPPASDAQSNDALSSDAQSGEAQSGDAQSGDAQPRRGPRVPWRGGGRVFYGWWIVAAVVGVEFMLAGLLVQAYGTYATAWRDAFGWSSTIISIAYGIHRAQRAVLSPVQGVILQRFGARRTMRVGMILFGVGLIALSRVGSLWMFFGAFLIASVGTSLTGVLSLSTVLVNWFARRRATALALMNTGKSLGGLAVPAVAWSIGAWGWRPSLVVSGGIALTAGLALTQVMRTRPEEVGLAPDGEEPEEVEHEDAGSAEEAQAHADADDERASSASHAGPEHGTDENGERAFSTRQAMRTRAFWLLSAGHALAVSVVSAVIVHLVLYLNEAGPYTLEAAAGFFALMTGFSIAGQLVGGPVGDRMEKRKLAAMAALGHAAGAVLLAVTQSVVGVVAFAALHGLAWGVRAPLMGALRADYFGRKKYATIMGWSSSIVMLGSILGPVVVGVAADAGSYQLGFGIVAILAIAASACFLLAYDPVPSPAEGA